MSLDAWLTLAVLVVLIVVLVREMIQPALAVLGATIALLLMGVVTPGQAFAGFSNEAPIIVGALLVLGRGAELSGLVHLAVQRMFGGTTSLRVLLGRLTYPVAAVSAILNNTTVVAMTVPPVLDFGERRGLPPSRLLIPVSYAAVLGGVVTAIGTSTNLTVSGLLSNAGMRPLSLLELTPVGAPIAIAGVLALVVLAPRLLPERGSPRDVLAETERGFTVTMQIQAGGPLDGETVGSAGLRNLKGVFLVEIERDGRLIAPVSPEEDLHAGDQLTFVGRVDQVVDLQRIAGMESAEAKHVQALAGASHHFYEAVVGSEMGIAGRTLKQVGFRRQYGGAVVAIHRAGQRIQAKLGEVQLRMGDTLLVLADPDFRQRWIDSHDFLLIAPLRGISPTQPRKAWTMGLIAAGFLVVTGTGLMPILQASLAAAALVMVTGVLTVRQARDALDLNVLVLIAAAIGLGTAVQTSGLGAEIASVLVHLLMPFGAIGALAAVLVATMALTEAVSNNAAAALMFPIALATATAVGADPRPFVIAVTLGASLSFLTPFGYQTNLMVYGIGGYRFTDYTRMGLPLNLLTIALSLLLIPIVFPF
jgi:di/tricarboxylate transporter